MANDRRHLENLKLWEDLNSPIAPLSNVQRDGVVELTALANKWPLLQAGNIALNDSESKENAEKGFKETQASQTDIFLKDKIDNAQQFFSWYSSIEDEMCRDGDAVYQNHIRKLKKHSDEFGCMLREIDQTLNELKKLNEQYRFVSNKTNSLHESCEELLLDQKKLNKILETVETKLEYFEEYEKLSTRLSVPDFNISNDTFIPTLKKLDECIIYMSKNLNYKESPVYLTKFKLLLGKALAMIRQFIVVSFQRTTKQVLPETETKLSSADTFTLFYGKFRSNASRIKVLVAEIETRAEKFPEYQQILIECYNCYFDQRDILLGPSVDAAISELAKRYDRDHCTFVRSGCTFLIHVCEDEYQLFCQFFNDETEFLVQFLESVCMKLYDTLRPIFVHIQHLETLAELCGILRIEMLEDNRHESKKLEAFSNIASQMLQDVQERLVYRTHIYIRSDILNYNPSPGDLAYPEKLEMMQSIAESLQDNERLVRSDSRTSMISLGSVTSQEVANINCNADLERRKSSTGNSPADLLGMWYPPVRRTLICLSKLYRCLERPIFQGLSQEVLSMCSRSLLLAGKTVSQNKTPVDGQLFQIKHLLILREQIAPFQAEFAVKETSLDFTKVRSAAVTLLQKRNKLFAMNSNNALLEFLVDGAPQVVEHYLDSKKEVDTQLKDVCEQFITQTSQALLHPITDFMKKVESFKTLNSGHLQGKAIHLPAQPFATPDNVREVSNSTLKLIKTSVPPILNSLHLYLANHETEIILFRPVRSNIMSSFQAFSMIVTGMYSEEEQLVIACPSQEQLSLLLASLINPN